MRVKTTLTALAVAGLTLTACGGGASAEEFCTSWNEADQAFSGSVSSPDDLQSVLDKVDELKEQAPEEIKGDVDYMATQINSLESIMSDAGLDMEDLGAIATGGTLEGVDDADMAKLQTDMAAWAENLDNDEAQQHSDAIEAYVAQNCDGGATS